MLILPQITPPLIMPNDAVSLWDGVTPTATFSTKLTANTPDPVTSPQTTIPFSGTASFWLKRASGSAGTIFNSHQNSGDERGFNIAFFGSGGLQLTLRNNDNVYSPFSFDIGLNNNNWNHILMSWNWFSSPATWKVVINDTPSFSDSQSIGASLDPFYRGYFNVNGHQDAPATGVNSLSLYDVVFFANVSDVYDINIRRKFIDAAGKPVKLGSKGRRPFGSTPILFYSGSFGAWRKNKGFLSDLSMLAAGLPINFTKSPTKPA